MTFYPYLPNLFAIYLIAVSKFTELYAVQLIPDKHQRNIAVDWEIRLSSISAVISSLISLYSVFETSQSFVWLTATSVILVMIFVPLLFWIISHKAGHLASEVTGLGHLRHGSVCGIVLVIVNVLIIAAIYINQRLTIPR